MLDEGLERGSGTWSGSHRSIWDPFFCPPLIKVFYHQMLKKLNPTKISMSVCLKKRKKKKDNPLLRATAPLPNIRMFFKMIRTDGR